MELALILGVVLKKNIYILTWRHLLMAIGQLWSQVKCPIATVNRFPCRTVQELQHKLRQVLAEKRGPVEIAIHDPAAQRVFLSLAIYSPEELLPQGVGSLVGNMRQKSSTQRTTMDRPENLGMSLAITAVMNDSQSPTAMVIGSAVLSAINKGYGNISFGTTPKVFHPGESQGAVVIYIQT